MAVITMRQMLEAGVHFGHQTRRWNPKMKRFIFGERNGIYIIDLEQTLGRVETAYGYVRDLVAGGGTILFVGTKKQAQDPVSSYAEKCGMPYVNERWLGGMLTNFETISKRVGKMLEYERMQASGEFDAMIKKEALLLDRELDQAAAQPRWSPRHEARRPTRSSCSTPRRSTSRSPRPTSSASRWSPSSTPTSTPKSSSTRSRATTTPSAPTACFARVDRRRRRGGPLHRQPSATRRRAPVAERTPRRRPSSPPPRPRPVTPPPRPRPTAMPASPPPRRSPPSTRSTVAELPPSAEQPPTSPSAADRGGRRPTRSPRCRPTRSSPPSVAAAEAGRGAPHRRRAPTPSRRRAGTPHDRRDHRANKHGELITCHSPHKTSRRCARRPAPG